MEYTKEQKKEYIHNLREKWKVNKVNADQDIDAKKRFEAIQNEAGQISYYSFYFTLQMMKQVGYEGNPYIDTKTYEGWKQTGFKVKKGEKSKISGITWMDISEIPKLYHLFHISQVEEIEEVEHVGDNVNL